jgi:glycosyltransferase involved in cell wall biosynthesis
MLPYAVCEREDRMAAPLWIAWERQRRTLELSSRLGCRLRIFEHRGPGVLRYPWSALRTALLLSRERPSLVVVQNPSMALAALACACKRLFGFALVVDRHSNFLLARRRRDDWKARLFLALSRYTLRNADLTLVTNGEIADRVLAAGGRPFVLPDPYPDVACAPPPPARPVPEAVFVCSWAEDEPIAEMMAACEALRGEAVVRATGRPKPRHSALLGRKPGNFLPTGFLADADYLRLLAGADAVVVLTTMPSTLLCGAYEALALGKPLLLSGSRALREYFTAGAVHLETHHPEEIARKLRLLLARRAELRQQGIAFLEASRAAWRSRREELGRLLEALAPTRGPARTAGRPAGRPAAQRP